MYRKNARKWKVDPALLVEYITTHPKTCDICKKPESEVGTLHLDHCHDTNNIRGLLCKNCNPGIGQFKNSIDLLLCAIEYLKKPPVLTSGTIDPFPWKTGRPGLKVEALKSAAENDRRQSDA